SSGTIGAQEGRLGGEAGDRSRRERLPCREEAIVGPLPDLRSHIRRARTHFDESVRAPAGGRADVRAAQQVIRTVRLEAVATESEEIFLGKLVTLGAHAERDRRATQIPEIEADAAPGVSACAIRGA